MQQSLVVRLREDLLCRRMQSGLTALEDHRDFLESTEPEQPGAIVLLGYLASTGGCGLRFTRAGEAASSPASPGQPAIHLPLIEFLHLRMAEALAAMSDEDFEKAAAALRFVGSIEDQLRDTELLALAWFWTGRCLRRLGQYDDALRLHTESPRSGDGQWT